MGLEFSVLLLMSSKLLFFSLVGLSQEKFSFKFFSGLLGPHLGQP